MKQIIAILALLSISISFFGQRAGKNNIIILNSIDSLKIKVIKQLEVKPGQDIACRYYLLYKKRDTLYLSTDLPGSLSLDSCLVYAKQLDGKGLPEIIVKLSKNYGTSSGSTTEIWNIDTKKQMFKVVNTLWARCENMCFAQKPLVFCNFDYSLSFDKNHNIIVKNLNNNSENVYQKKVVSPDSLHQKHVQCCSCDPNQQEGVFSLVDGRYVWARDN